MASRSAHVPASLLAALLVLVSVLTSVVTRRRDDEITWDDDEFGPQNWEEERLLALVVDLAKDGREAVTPERMRRFDRAAQKIVSRRDDSHPPVRRPRDRSRRTRSVAQTTPRRGGDSGDREPPPADRPRLDRASRRGGAR